MGGWWRWALVSPDGVAPSRMFSVSASVNASVNLPLHRKVQKFYSGTGSPGWSRKKGRENGCVCVCVCVCVIKLAAMWHWNWIDSKWSLQSAIWLHLGNGTLHLVCKFCLINLVYQLLSCVIWMTLNHATLAIMVPWKIQHHLVA